MISDVGVFEDIFFFSTDKCWKTTFNARSSYVLSSCHADIVHIVGVGVDGFVIIF